MLLLRRTKCTVLPPAPLAARPRRPTAVWTRPSRLPVPCPAHPAAQPLSSRACQPPSTARNARWREPQRSGAPPRPSPRRHRHRLPTPPTHSRESRHTSRENDPVAEPAQKEQGVWGAGGGRNIFPRALEGKAAGRPSRDAEAPSPLAWRPSARGSFKPGADLRTLG